MKRKIRLMMLLAWLVFGCAIVTTSYVRAQKSDDQIDKENHGDRDEGDEARIARGFAIAPVHLRFQHKNRELVGLGSYIVNAQAGCSDCHTNPPFKMGGDPHLGQPEQINTEVYLAGGQMFGPFTSRNLTPDAQGLPAGMTLQTFIHIMRTGEDDDHILPNVPSATNDLLQVMPWPVYRKMSDHDLRAIYEYLRAIPSRPDNYPPLPHL